VSGETERAPSGWTVDTLHTHMQRQHDDLTRALDERYATQTKAVDAAFVAADKAVQAALSAAEKAVVKAEGAAEKRFESVNEFRQTLADQATAFPTRAEVDAKYATLGARMAALEKLTERAQGRDAGATETRAGLRLDASTVTAALALAVAIYVAFGR
jgi:hypothetical protein